MVGRPGPHREHFEVVTARSFAGPAVTAEIAAGFVAVGGVLVVSEPPDPDCRTLARGGPGRAGVRTRGAGRSVGSALRGGPQDVRDT